MSKVQRTESEATVKMQGEGYSQQRIACLPKLDVGVNEVHCLKIPTQLMCKNHGDKTMVTVGFYSLSRRNAPDNLKPELPLLVVEKDGEEFLYPVTPKLRSELNMQVCCQQSAMTGYAAVKITYGDLDRSNKPKIISVEEWN